MDVCAQREILVSVTVISASLGLMIGTLVSLILWAGLAWLLLRWAGILPRAR